MYCTRKVTDDLIWVGADDRRLACFEGVCGVPDGVSYNSYVLLDEKMDSVMAKFEKTGAWNLPVVTKDRKYVGFVSKSKIFSAYRTQLKEVSHE